jgi:hypothetical protein
MRPTAVSLFVLEPLVPQDAPPRQGISSSGLTSYARNVLALVYLFSQDRTFVRSNAWALNHVLTVSEAARDELAVPGSASDLLGGSLEKSSVQEIAARSDMIYSYAISLFASDLGNAWHTSAIGALRQAKGDTIDGDGLLPLLSRVIGVGRQSSQVYPRRILARLLRSILQYSDNSVDAAERWFAFGQSFQDSGRLDLFLYLRLPGILIILKRLAPDLSVAIVYATRDWLFERPRFQRYQNELASDLSAVPVARANSRGLPLLRLLVTAAPPTDSTSDFIPSHRAIFLLQNLAKWFTSEADDEGEDMGDEVHTRLAELFLPLAPVLQNMNGAHWDFMFNVLESNLEVSGQHSTIWKTF